MTLLEGPATICGMRFLARLPRMQAFNEGSGSVQLANGSIYGQLGPYYLLLVAAVASAVAAGFAAFDTVVLQMYRDVGSRGFPLLFAVGQAVNAFGLAVGFTVFGLGPLVGLWRALRRIAEPLQARAALDLAARFPARVVPPIALVIMLCEVPAILWFRTTQHLDVSLLVTLVAILAPNAAAAFFLYLGLELLLRPIVRDAAKHLDASDDLPLVAALSLRQKLLFGLPVVNFMTAYVTAAFVEQSSNLTVRIALALAAALAVTLTVSMLFTTTLVHAFSDPIRRLIDGTSRVGRGDLSVSVDVLSGDEIGVLGRHFNQMTEGLRERARVEAALAVLAQSNVELEGRVAEQIDEIRDSRARIVEAADEGRRRVERNIHDGAQQQLVAISLDLRVLAEEAADLPRAAIKERLQAAYANLRVSLDDLRELARGLHPAVLTTDGLEAALTQLAARAPLPISIAAPEERFPEYIETAAYFVAAEVVANAVKHAQARRIRIRVAELDGNAEIEISDDGQGGAEPSPGSGLAGLVDRVEAVGGSLAIVSPHGVGTTVTARLPLGGSLREIG